MKDSMADKTPISMQGILSSSNRPPSQAPEKAPTKAERIPQKNIPITAISLLEGRIRVARRVASSVPSVIVQKTNLTTLLSCSESSMAYYDLLYRELQGQLLCRVITVPEEGGW